MQLGLSVSHMKPFGEIKNAKTHTMTAPLRCNHFLQKSVTNIMHCAGTFLGHEKLPWS